MSMTIARTDAGIVSQSSAEIRRAEAHIGHIGAESEPVGKGVSADRRMTDTVSISENAAYLKGLQQQFPGMKFSIGTGLAGRNKQNTGDNADRRAFTLSPKLLEKMRTDPQAEAEYTQRIRDIERATSLVEGISRARGMKTVYCENYIDENGKLHHASISVRKDALNEKLRREAEENTAKHIEHIRERNREAAKELAEKLDSSEAAVYYLQSKFEQSDQEGLVLDGKDMEKLIEAMKSEASDASAEEASEVEEEESAAASGKGSVGINAAKLARMLAAAKTRSQVQAVIAKIQADLDECDRGRDQGMDVDEGSYSAAQTLLQQARQKLGSVENREPTPEEAMQSSLAGLM